MLPVFFWVRVGHKRNLCDIWKVVLMKQPQFLCFGAWCRAPETMVTHSCCCWTDSSSYHWFTILALPTKPPPHILFVLDQVGMLAWCQMTPTSPKVTHYCGTEGGETQTSWFHYPHGSSIFLWVTVWLCFGLYPTLFYKYYSSWLTVNSVSAPHTKIAALYTLFHQI